MVACCQVSSVSVSMSVCSSHDPQGKARSVALRFLSVVSGYGKFRRKMISDRLDLLISLGVKLIKLYDSFVLQSYSVPEGCYSGIS